MACTFYSAAVELADFGPPGAMGGPLSPRRTSPGVRIPETFFALCADLGSGTRSMTVLLNGRSILRVDAPLPSRDCAPTALHGRPPHARQLFPCPSRYRSADNVIWTASTVLSVYTATDATGDTSTWVRSRYRTLVLRRASDGSIRAHAAARTDTERRSPHRRLRVPLWPHRQAGLVLKASGHPRRRPRPMTARRCRRDAGVEHAPAMTSSSFTALRMVTTDARGEFATRLPAGRPARSSCRQPGPAAGPSPRCGRSSKRRSASRRTVRARATGGPSASPARSRRPSRRAHACRRPGLGWPMGPIRGRNRQARAVLRQVHVQAHVSADQLPLPRRPAGRSELPVRRRDLEGGTRRVVP